MKISTLDGLNKFVDAIKPALLSLRQECAALDSRDSKRRTVSVSR